MDTTRDIIYRNFVLNDEDIEENRTSGGATGTGLSGCVVDVFDFSDVDVVQWSEKRSQGDGSDAGDVFLGSRRIRIAGTLYALTRNLLFDDLFSLRAALNPVLAQREEPLDKGYRPLYFSVPTNRVEDYPSGAIELKVLAMPRSIQHVTRRDDEGGEDDDPLAIPWDATLVCKDPGIYSASPVEVELDTYPSPVTGATGQNTGDTITKASHGLENGDRVTIYSGTGGSGLSTGVAYYVVNKTTDTFKVSLTSGGGAVPITGDYSNLAYIKSLTVSGTWDNRGTYLGKFNGLFAVGPSAGTISATVGDSAFTITLPVTSGNRIVRVKADNTVTVEEADAEPPAFDVLTFDGDTTWPLIDPGETPYSFTFHGMQGLRAGGRVWFDEQYA
jgi:hypothetical protein